MPPKAPSKALLDKRTRLVRLLDGHVRWLAIAATLARWEAQLCVHLAEPYPEAPRGGSGRQRPLPEYVSPRERGALAHPCPGPEALTDAEIAAWVEGDAFVRSGLRPATIRALCFIDTFKPKGET